METIGSILLDGALAFLSVILTAVAAKLGRYAREWMEDQRQGSVARSIATCAVQAVEQMYGDWKGEEKLGEAFAIAESFLAKRGISVSQEELTVLLESAVCEMKRAYRSGEAK